MRAQKEHFLFVEDKRKRPAKLFSLTGLVDSSVLIVFLFYIGDSFFCVREWMNCILFDVDANTHL